MTKGALKEGESMICLIGYDCGTYCCEAPVCCQRFHSCCASGEICVSDKQACETEEQKTKNLIFYILLSIGIFLLIISIFYYCCCYNKKVSYQPAPINEINIKMENL